MRRLLLRVAQSVRPERATGGESAQAKAQWTAKGAGVQMAPQELASAARPEGSMQIGLAIPVRVIPPQEIRSQTNRAQTNRAQANRPCVIPARMMTWSAQMMRTVFAAAGSARPPEVEARMLEQPCPAEELQPLMDRPSIRWADRATPLGMLKLRVWLSVLQLSSGLVG